METATNMYSRELSDGKRKVVGAMTEEKNTWCLAISTILAITIGTRYYKVTEPDHVCWDETHFGKMGSWYINRTFFFDVHPPLGKLILISGCLES
ncbi:protein O-mannosyl-transferase 2-like isoform X3 [Haematobia irritans]|uniref:protein O-mannosyl-transferase 2-like isoform X3 n=1 Tax=Haematobia irritans TaxID=7368 RepID=UPI003F4F92EC